jgi:hypothetical protein
MEFHVLFLIKKRIPPSRSKTLEIGQKTDGILGVNVPIVFASLENTLSLTKCMIQHTIFWYNIP